MTNRIRKAVRFFAEHEYRKLSILSRSFRPSPVWCETDILRDENRGALEVYNRMAHRKGLPMMEHPANEFVEGYTCMLGPSSHCRECYDNSGIESPLSFIEAVGSGACDGRTEFSNSTCDCCNTYLAGSRYTVHLHCNDSPTEPFMHSDSICEDCYHYMAAL